MITEGRILKSYSEERKGSKDFSLSVEKFSFGTDREFSTRCTSSSLFDIFFPPFSSKKFPFESHLRTLGCADHPQGQGKFVETMPDITARKYSNLPV